MPGIEHFLINPFLSPTRRSVGRTSTLGRFTDAALYEASYNPAIATLYNEYHLVWEAYLELRTGKDVVMGDGRGSTQRLQNAMRQLSGDIKEWAFAIETVYRRGTPGYVKLLPRGRAPFRTGAMVKRIAMVEALAIGLQDEPALATLHTTVAAAYTNLDGILTTAEGAVSHKGASRIQLEAARVKLCEALYAVLGGLIHLYPNDERKVKGFFDIATMHRHRHRKQEAG